MPSRTGINIEPATYEVLAEHGNIVGIKEASGNISKVVDTMARVRGLDLYSGNDDQIVPLMALGGIGGISVVSNIMPAQHVRFAPDSLMVTLPAVQSNNINFIPL